MKFIRKRFTLNTSSRLFQIAVILFVIGCVGDIITTSYGISTGAFKEGNPLLIAAFNIIGVVPALIIGKLLVGGLYITYPQIFPKYQTELSVLNFFIGAGMYIYISYYNFLML